jgi:hypothetical protein
MTAFFDILIGPEGALQFAVLRWFQAEQANQKISAPCEGFRWLFQQSDESPTKEVNDGL